MTRFIPTLACLALASPALAHPGHAGGATHWLALDHLAMLGTLAALAGGLIWRNRTQVRIRAEDEDRQRDA
ncbi:hypothetical protein KUV65_01840 [Maritalea mobilis]|uniref:DUF6732 family protein n=1 Tax=Maritalea mobilis TaxID=483324 RepID=UPI001C94380B|nr:DUF6732 family protein [Maritalea mobilis]MBY6200087.1 hypothetical protein [Maritalea mobilis]